MALTTCTALCEATLVERTYAAHYMRLAEVLSRLFGFSIATTTWWSDHLSEACPLQTLEENMRDGVVSNSLVAFLRMLTSCEIELKSDFFAPFIMVRCRAHRPGTADDLPCM